MISLIEQARSCTECRACMEVCPTYRATADERMSPVHRLQAAVRLHDSGEVSDSDSESLYSCLNCGRSEAVCPENIQISNIVLQSRAELCRSGLGPPPRKRRVIEGTLSKGNSVNGDPQRRLEWLPEGPPTSESDTLLFIGCLSSYLVKDAAYSTYRVLKKLGVDFMLLEDDGCCGSVFYTAGMVDTAKEWFKRNVERFDRLGIKRILVTCPVCLQSFKYHYPELLGEVGFTVQHVAEVIFDAMKADPDLAGNLSKVERRVSFKDPCTFVRGENLIRQPREILRNCGADIVELPEHGTDASCCGAGGGVRAIYRDLSTQVAADLLATDDTGFVVTACPFCTFNLNGAAKEKGLDKQCPYFTNLLLESMA